MFATAGYPVHPTRFATYDLPRTPQRSGENIHYSPRHFSYSTGPSKGHTRRATGDPATFYFTSPSHSTPGYRAYYSTPDFVSPSYHASAQSTPLRKFDHVSYSDRQREPPRAPREATSGAGKWQGRYSSSKQRSARTYVVLDEGSDSEDLPRYEPYEARPLPYMRRQSYYDAGADCRYYDQVPIYTPAEAKAKSRPRRASYAAKPTQPTPPRRPSTASRPPPKATEADARRHHIPAGYSLKNWDPTEEPIALLGSVFDANSLGKWIYDWTVFHYGPGTPMSEVAGELWLLLIQLAGKIKRAEECYGRIRQQASRDLVDDFLASGDRLWQRFTKLLRICETYMYRAAKKERNNSSEKLTMGKNSGCEFVDCIFGRDRELERTEALMQGMRLWGQRFDANCEDILRRPSA